ncbi:GPW/gp25 family protein [Dactylosporangium sp. NPDC005555]|uniref:GPW/gp25 family protein n=1 Tax=Dactylosporangium sp. NPDC005555 TaxID=3154889 RepID=UPI0033A0C92A
MRAIRFSPALTATGSLSMVDGDAAVRQALLLLLATTPGERLMRPLYGCHLNRLLFAPNDHTTAGLAVHYVRQAVQRWEPRAEIVSLDAAADPDVATRLTIQLRYRVRATLTLAELDIPLDLGPASDGSPS